MLYYQLRAFIRSALNNKELWNALLPAGAFLMFNLMFGFYPVLILLGLTIIVAMIGRKIPQLALVFELIISLPAVAYNSTGVAWVYLLVTSIVMVIAVKDYVNKSEYSERNWRIAAIIQLLVAVSFIAPVALLPLLVISSFYLSSKRVIPVMVVVITIILLLNSIGFDNETVSLSGKYSSLQIQKHKIPIAADTTGFVSAAVNALSSMLLKPDINKVGNVFFTNFSEIILNDNYILIVMVWVIPMFIIAFIPGHVKFKYEQTLTSLLIFVVPVALVWTGVISAWLWISAVLTVLIIGFLETFNIKISREEFVMLRAREKKFMMFGLKELTLAGEVNSLDDVGNYDDIKDELKETIITPLHHKHIVEAYGIKPPNGVLLFGPPGTGKTMIMTALAKEIDFAFFYVKSSNLTSPAFGISAKNISRLFKKARQNQPCILFFDEIDAIGKKRELLSEQGSRMLTTFLQELDGFKEQEKIIIIGATNKPEIIDAALLRPGRIDKIIYMGLPDIKGRKEIFRIHTRNMRVGSIDYNLLSRLSKGYTGADIKILCEEVNRTVADSAVKKRKIVNISTNDFSKLIKKMKPSVSARDIEKYRSFKILYERRFGKSIGEDRENEIINMEKVLKIIDKSYKDNVPLLLFGAEGNGKSFAVKHFAKKKGLSYSVLDCSEKVTTQKIKSLLSDIIIVERIEELNPKYTKTIMRMMKNSNVFITSVKPWVMPKEMLKFFEIYVFVGLPNKESRRCMLNKYEVYDERVVNALAGCTYSEVMRAGALITKLKIKGKIKNIGFDENVTHIILSQLNKVSEQDVKLYKRFLNKILEP